jgi:hypothetical protein
MPTARETVFVIGCAILFGVVFSYPILEHLSRVGGFYDFDLMLELHWAAAHSVARFHQLPLWNPYKCGGIPMLANPQSRIVTPFFALSLLFGPFVGLNLEIPLHLAIGWSGGYVLARVQGLSRSAGVVCGSIFAGSSWFPLHIGVGHPAFLPALYLPWIVAFLWLSFARRKLFPVAMAAAVVALMLGEAGVYAIGQVFLLAGLLGFTIAISERRWWPIVVVAALALFSIGFAAVKLLPTLELMRAHPRPWNVAEATPLRMILYALFSRNQQLDRLPPIGQWEFWEYGAYIGVLAALLAAVGIVTSFRRATPWLVAGIVLFALAMGGGGPCYPWTLLHKLPIFSSERAAPRCLIPFVLVVGVLAASGADFIHRRCKAAGARAVYFVAAAMLIDFWLVSVPNLQHAVLQAAPAVTPAPVFRQNLNRSVLSMLPMTMANEGAINCYEYTNFYSSAAGFNGPGYRGEQYLLGPGTVQLVRWTPNALTYEVAAPQPGIMVVNQNYFPSWRLSRGRGEVFSHHGLLAVRVPAGDQRITLSYRDNAFVLGALISMLTMLVALAVMFLERRGLDLTDSAMAQSDGGRQDR